jgi:hypothetical protein
MAQFHLIFCEPDHIIEKSFGRDFRSEPGRPLDLTAGPCSAKPKIRLLAVVIEKSERGRMRADARLVPLAGIEPALLAELDFESSASTSSATGAFGGPRNRRREAGGI